MPDGDQPQRRQRIGLRPPIPAKKAAAPSGRCTIVNRQVRSTQQVLHELEDTNVRPQQQVSVQINSQGLGLHDVFESQQQRAARPEPVMEGGQPAAAAADPGSRKRMREDKEHSNPDEDTVDDLLIAALSTVPQTVLSDLRTTLTRLHSVRLESVRQIAAMEERKRNNEPPHGWRLPVFHMPDGTDQHDAAAKEKIKAAYVESYDDMIAGREAHGLAADTDIKSALNDRRESQWILAGRMMKGNPTRYSRIQQDDVMFKIDQQLEFELMKAEVTADKKAAKSYVSRAKSAEAVKPKADEKTAATAHLKDNITVSDLMAALDKQKAEFQKLIEDKAHAPPKA